MRNQFLFLLFLSFLPANLSNSNTIDSNTNMKLMMEEMTSNKNNEMIKDSSKLKELIAAIIWYESSNGTILTNPNEPSVGITQQHTCVVDDVNEYLGYKKYSYNDRLDPVKSIEIFILYQARYNPEFNIEKAARVWNGGPDGLSNPKTIKYWSNIKKFMQKEWYDKSIIHTIKLPELLNTYVV